MVFHFSRAAFDVRSVQVCHDCSVFAKVVILSGLLHFVSLEKQEKIKENKKIGGKLVPLWHEDKRKVLELGDGHQAQARGVDMCGGVSVTGFRMVSFSVRCACQLALHYL